MTSYLHHRTFHPHNHSTCCATQDHGTSSYTLNLPYADQVIQCTNPRCKLLYSIGEFKIDILNFPCRHCGSVLKLINMKDRK